MMRTFGLLLVASLAVLALVPSTSAMSFVPPPRPDPQCPVTPEPQDGGLVGAVEQIAHDTSGTACSDADIVIAQGQAGYDFAIGEVGIIITQLSPIVDGTQDGACTFLFGNPNANNAVCHEIVLDMNFSGV